MSVWAVLVAAGAGERLGDDRPKAFARLGGRPLLAESLARLDACEWVDRIVVAAPPGWEEPAILVAEELVASKVVACVTGGSTRAQSVRAALAEVDDTAVAVLVHDAARPLVTDEIVARVLAPLAEGFAGAVPCLALSDTVKRLDQGVVVETVDRRDLVIVQTPQAFDVEILRRAYSGDLSGSTDCSTLVEAIGGRVKSVDGDPRLLKITTRCDLDVVTSWL